MILSSGVVADNEISKIIKIPSEYIESKEYFSWEKFFTDLLEKKTAGTYMEYNKKTINEYYLSSGNIDRILAVLNGLFEDIR